MSSTVLRFIEQNGIRAAIRQRYPFESAARKIDNLDPATEQRGDAAREVRETRPLRPLDR